MTDSSYSYGEAKYWDDRYTREGQGVVSDWYQAYSALKPVITHYCKKPSKVLMSGCGNSGEYLSKHNPEPPPYLANKKESVGSECECAGLPLMLWKNS